MKQFIFSAFIFLLLTGIKDASACSMLGLTGGAGYSSPFISASTHPNNNPHNLNCYYRINAQSSSNVIKVNFRNVNVEVGSCCNTDYFAVYEGSSATSRLIGKYCGQHSSIVLQGRGQYMYIHYHTDGSVYSTGFELQFTVSASATPSCDQLSIGGGPGTGFITSPNYPSNYPHQADCRYRINAGSATRTITLTFTAFNLESHPDCKFDFVEVRTQLNAHCAPNVKKYCGSTVPTTQTITGQQYAYIQFFTDSSVTRPGFRMEWTVSGDPSCSILDLAGSVGHVSPYYSASTHPANNPHNTDCYYQINGESTSNVIKVEFTSFSLEANANCAFDYVAVYEGPSATSRLIAKYCGNKTPFSVSGRGQYMYMHYHTDGSVHSTGFQFRFSVSASATPSCDQLSIGGGPGTGYITSPNYPGNYPHKADCRYRINAGSTSRTITLRFTAFNLESHSSCRYDFVEVRTTANAHCAPNARKYCGTTVPATQTITGQRYVYIQFFTDSSVTRSGFRLQWTVSGQVGGSCNMLGLTGGAGYSSPYYSASTHPSNNPHNLNCYYRINAQSSSNVIKVDFRRMQIENHSCCNFDYVAVYEGYSTSSRLIGKYCGTNSSFSVQGRGRYMYMHYHTDSSRYSTGFQFRFSVSASATPSCDQLSIGGGPGTGYITSPNYPSNYPHKADCRYRINAGSASRTITLRFTAFNLESHSYCRYDFVEVRTQLNAHCAPNARKYCGTTVPATQTITGQQYVYIQFFTDSSVTRSGFRLQWTISGGDSCDQLNLGGGPGSTGLIKSPNYPGNYPQNIDCKYKVYSGCSSNNVRFAFSAFNIETNSQCRYDYVEIFSGCSTNLGSQGKFCGTTIPAPSTSYGTSCKSMRFKTDRSVARSGFNMRYTVTGRCCPSSGVISSPSFPLNYHNNADNCYVICPPGARRIRLRFTTFILEGSEPNCSYDSLTIKRSFCTSGTQLDKFCGTKRTPFTRTYTATKLALKFKTDRSVVKKGFSLFFSRVL
nr:cubilin isoform X1 [Ciona intestinalis]|eukprot:XP_018673033.1 cubilin isoform X1 [Ciona intestinalis]